MNKILTIDPSGTGTSGLFLTDGKTQEFTQYQGTNWQDHLEFLIDYIKEKQPTQIIYEHSNYIHKKTADGLGLFKLFGAIEGLIYTFPFLTQIIPISVIKVKGFYKRLYEQKEQIPHLTYKIGRGNGWIYQGQRLSLHQVDAFLIYYIYKNGKKI
jgi:hypothetical protein